MNTLALCLSILPVSSPQPSAPPPMLEIVQNHIAQEMRREIPGLLVNFGIATCPHVIHFEEGIASLTLRGESAVWRGEKVVDYTDALSHRPVNFEENLTPPMAPRTALGSGTPWGKWALWTGVGLLAAGGVYYLTREGGSRPAPAETTKLQTGIKF